MGDLDDSGSYEKTVTTRVTPRTYEKYQEYLDKHDLSKSDGLRRLIRDGLNADDESTLLIDEGNVLTRGSVAAASIMAGAVYLTIFIYGLTFSPSRVADLGAAVGGAFIVVMILWSTTSPLWK